MLKLSYEERSDENNALFEVKYISTLELLENIHNLMPIIGVSSTKNQDILHSFLSKIRKCSGSKLKKIKGDMVKEGFHASPAGLSELVFITKQLDKARTERAFLILKNEKRDSLDLEIKNSSVSLEIPKSQTRPALRTLTSVKKFNVENVDYVLNQKPAKFERILQLSKWEGGFDWFKHSKNVQSKSSYVVVGRRFRPNSKNTHHFAFFLYGIIKFI